MDKILQDMKPIGKVLLIEDKEDNANSLRFKIQFADTEEGTKAKKLFDNYNKWIQGTYNKQERDRDW